MQGNGRGNSECKRDQAFYKRGRVIVSLRQIPAMGEVLKTSNESKAIQRARPSTITGTSHVLDLRLEVQNVQVDFV